MLPAATAPEAEGKRARGQSSIARGRVLVVDDDPSVASALASALEGHEVVVASGGQEAIERCKSQSFDCILCDLMMPGVTGMDVYDALRRDERGMERRMVFITGGAVTESARKRIAVVSNTVLEKPIETEPLRAAVALALQSDRR
jgi:CheY-like chemotaxis protein